MFVDSASGHDEVTEVILELGRHMNPDDVEREVAARFPWLDEERLAAAWLLAVRVNDGLRFVTGSLSESSLAWG